MDPWIDYITKSGVGDALEFQRLRNARQVAEASIDERGLLSNPTGDSVVAKVLTSKESVLYFRRMSMPLGSQWAENVVRHALGFIEGARLTDRDVKVAVLSAVLMPLRQTVGSCFATAPAILIQREHPELLVKDLYDLLTMGMLKRVYHGKESKVPMCIRTGSSDLYRTVFDPEAFTFHPALLEGFAAAGLIETHRRLERMQELLLPLVSSVKGPLRVKAFIRQVLLDSMRLKEAQIDAYQVRERDYSPMFVATKETLSRDKEIELFLKREQIVLNTFNHFAKHALLKVWEFTIASFTDYKVDVTRRNLTVAIGLQHDAVGGVGECVYNYLGVRLDESNAKLQEMHGEYLAAADRVNMTQRLLANVDSAEKARRLKAELDAHLHHMHACLDERNEAQKRSEHFSKFFEFLMQEYHDKFILYFQELYDPDMVHIDAKLFEDSPAGFRLVYKHGRAEPSVWSLIEDEKTYVEALSSFFITTEQLITAACDWEDGKEAVQICTRIVLEHIETESFKRSAMNRIADLHKQTGRGAASPWSYISGGTIETLIDCYFSLPNPCTVHRFQPQSVEDLCICLIEMVRDLPLDLTDRFASDPKKGLLMHSPNHAFILQPGFTKFKELWQSDQFTYTYLRDHYIEPVRDFYRGLLLSKKEQDFLLQGFPHHHLPDHCTLADLAASFPQKSQTAVSMHLRDVLHAHFGAPEALLIADTNWPHFNFAFQVHPVTLKLELWRISQDGTQGIPMTEWNGFYTGHDEHTWGVLTKPFEYGGVYTKLRQ